MVTVKGDLGGVLLDVCNVGPLFSQLSSWYKIDGPFLEGPYVVHLCTPPKVSLW